MGVLLYGLVVLVWGLTWIAIKYQLGDVPMAASIFYRSAAAALLLFAWLWLRKAHMRYSLKNHGRMVLIGAFMFSVNYLFLYASEQHIPSGLVALIFAMTLPLNVFNAAIFLGRRIARTVVIGTLVGLLGMALVFWRDVANFDANGDSLLGIAQAFGAAFCFSLGNIVSDRAQSDGVPIVQSEAYGMLYGAALLVPAVLLTGGFSFDFGAPYVLSLTYLVVFGSIVGFGTYLLIIGRIGAERAGYVTVLFPIVALAVSTFVEDYRWTLTAMLGALLIVVGNAVVSTPPAVLNRLWARIAGPTPPVVPEDAAAVEPLEPAEHNRR